MTCIMGGPVTLRSTTSSLLSSGPPWNWHGNFCLLPLPWCLYPFGFWLQPSWERAPAHPWWVQSDGRHVPHPAAQCPLQPSGVTRAWPLQLGWVRKHCEKKSGDLRKRCSSIGTGFQYQSGDLKSVLYSLAENTIYINTFNKHRVIMCEEYVGMIIYTYL